MSKACFGILFDYYKTQYFDFLQTKVNFAKHFSTKSEKTTKNRTTQKQVLNSSFLTRLEHPIFLDFGFSYLPSNFQTHSLNGVPKSKEQEKNFSFDDVKNFFIFQKFFFFIFDKHISTRFD
jgi:hypothetical protein